METVEINGKELFKAEVGDVLQAKRLGDDVTFGDWPYGRTKRCVMRFYVERSKNGRKQRMVKYSVFNGRTNKPKKDTYCKKVLLLEIDDMLCHLHFSEYGSARLAFENGRYLTVHFHDTDAAVLWNEMIQSN